jgi:type VI secretion system protein ImpB
VRKPRVRRAAHRRDPGHFEPQHQSRHITYDDVETGGAQVKRELPFVVGVMGDFSGNPTQRRSSRWPDRKFTQIDRDNFNDVMAKHRARAEHEGRQHARPATAARWPSTLKFNSMDDFEPGRVAEQVEPLKALMETRNKLRDLMSEGRPLRGAREPARADVLQELRGLKKLKGSGSKAQ